jgi:hypothetical protein
LGLYKGAEDENAIREVEWQRFTESRRSY